MIIGTQDNTEKILHVAAGADISDADVNKMYTISQCKSVSYKLKVITDLFLYNSKYESHC